MKHIVITATKTTEAVDKSDIPIAPIVNPIQRNDGCETLRKGLDVHLLLRKQEGDVQQECQREPYQMAEVAKTLFSNHLAAPPETTPTSWVAIRSPMAKISTYLLNRARRAVVNNRKQAYRSQR